MEEHIDGNTLENFYKISFDDDCSSVMTDVPSSPWFDEDDIISSTPKENFLNSKSNNDVSFSVLYGKDIDAFKLKEEEIDLYKDLIKAEEEEKRKKNIHQIEFGNLKKEVEMLREDNAKKDTRIDDLTLENTKLLKSMSSLYNTIKSEIERKDNLLAEANRKLDYIRFHKNAYNIKPTKHAETQTSTHDEEKDRNLCKRKRVESCKSSDEMELESSTSNTNNEVTITEKDLTDSTEYDSSQSKPKSAAEMKKSDNQCSLNHTQQTSSSNVRDSFEDNNKFCSDLPEPLKKSFYEFEQKQITSLNRLKQSLLNEYNNLEANIQSPTPDSTSDRPRIAPRPFSPWNKARHNPLSNSYRNNWRSPRKLYNSAHVGTNESKDRRSMDKDVKSHFRYRNRRTPFTERRKGLGKY